MVLNTADRSSKTKQDTSCLSIACKMSAFTLRMTVSVLWLQGKLTGVVLGDGFPQFIFVIR